MLDFGGPSADRPPTKKPDTRSGESRLSFLLTSITLFTLSDRCTQRDRATYRRGDNVVLPLVLSDSGTSEQEMRESPQDLNDIAKDLSKAEMEEVHRPISLVTGG